MLNLSLITRQIEEWLRDDPDLVDVTVTRGEPGNEDSGIARNGWIGIYRRGVDYEAGALKGPTNNYDADFRFALIVQKTNMESGAKAEEDIEALVQTVIERVLTLPRTYLDHIPEFSVEYGYVETDRKTMYFQAAVIDFVAEFSS